MMGGRGELWHHLTGPHQQVPSMPAIQIGSRRRANLRLPFWTSMLHALSRPDAEKGNLPDVDELDGWILVRFQ